MDAYDYENQRWVSGPEASEIYAKQLRDELALLKSDRGESYFQFSRKAGAGGPLNLREAIAMCEDRLAAVNGMSSFSR